MERAVGGLARNGAWPATTHRDMLTADVTTVSTLAVILFRLALRCYIISSGSKVIDSARQPSAAFTLPSRFRYGRTFVGYDCAGINLGNRLYAEV